MPDTPLFSTPLWLKEILADPFNEETGVSQKFR